MTVNPVNICSVGMGTTQLSCSLGAETEWNSHNIEGNSFTSALHVTNPASVRPYSSLLSSVIQSNSSSLLSQSILPVTNLSGFFNFISQASLDSKIVV